MTLTAEDLLVGAGATHEVTVPAALLAGEHGDVEQTVVLRPLTVRDLQQGGPTTTTATASPRR